MSLLYPSTTAQQVLGIYLGTNGRSSASVTQGGRRSRSCMHVHSGFADAGRTPLTPLICKVNAHAQLWARISGHLSQVSAGQRLTCKTPWSDAQNHMHSTDEQVQARPMYIPRVHASLRKLDVRHVHSCTTAQQMQCINHAQTAGVLASLQLRLAAQAGSDLVQLLALQATYVCVMYACGHA